MSETAVTLGMKSFKNLCRRYSAKRSIMVRGRPGIGKSQSVYQLAEDHRSDFYKSQQNCLAATGDLTKEASVRRRMRRFFQANPVVAGEKDVYSAFRPSKENLFGVWHYDMGLPPVERRLSQLTEGDVTGLPSRDRLGTVFLPCAWLMLSVEYPCMLFLDELNRAIKGVEQATFQLADSHAFYGHELHEGTRLMIATNIGDQFDVTPIYPAAISRYAIVDLEPTFAEFIDHAMVVCNPAFVDFIKSNDNLLEYRGVYEPDTKYPDRRAWVNLDSELQQAGLYDDPTDRVFLDMSASMVGFQAGNKFWNFVKDRQKDISAKEIVMDWPNAKKRLGKLTDDAAHSKFVELGNKLQTWLTAKNPIPKGKNVNVAKFMEDAPAEVRMVTWQALCAHEPNLLSVHPLVEELIVATVGAGTQMPAQPPAATEVPEPKKKGKR